MKPFSLVDLSILISPRSNSLMAVLRGYFDSSEKKEDTFSLSGYVGAVEAWTNFENNWRKVLKDYGVTYLHMKEFAHFWGEFEGWDKDEEKRKRFLQELIEVIKSSGLYGFGAVLFLDDLKRINSERSRNIGAYPFCLFMCMIELNIFYQQDPIELILDRDNGCQSAISKAIAYAETDKCYAGCDEKIVMSCLPKKGLSFKDIPEIQAADFAAYELRLHYERKKIWYQEEKPTVKPSEWMTSIMFWDLTHNWNFNDKKRNQKLWPDQRQSLGRLMASTDIYSSVWDYTAICGVDLARGGIWPE